MVEGVDIGDIGLQHESKEQLGVHFSTVEANSFRTRGEPISLAINGETTNNWHSVKGGQVRERRQSGAPPHISYEIFYNPDQEAWLKIVPPQVNSNRSTKRLQKSAEIAKAALEVADLGELKDEIKDCTVTINGKEVYGFISPHLGQSVSHYFTEAQKRGDEPGEVEQLIRSIYEIAFNQAVELYEKHGYWMDDPNPGNILIHDKDGQYHIVLIDFSNKEQEKASYVSSIPPGAIDEEKRKSLYQDKYDKDITLLRTKFDKQQGIAARKYTQSLSTSLTDFMSS